MIFVSKLSKFILILIANYQFLKNEVYSKRFTSQIEGLAVQQ